MNRGKGDWVGQVTEAAGHTFISLYLLTLDSWVRRGESFPCSLSSCALGPDSTILSLSACSQPCTVWKAAQGIPGLIEQKEPRVWRAARGSRLAGELAAAGRARTRSLLMTRLNISCSGPDAPVVDSTGPGAPNWCVCRWGLPRATSGLLRHVGFAWIFYEFFLYKRLKTQSHWLRKSQ